MIQGFFFDLDGTLVNTYDADFMAYRDAIQEAVGTTIEQRAFAQTHGMDMAVKLQRLVPDFPAERYGEIRDGKKRFYRQYVDSTKTNEALVKFLAQFAKHAQCVLVTSAKRDNALAVLQHHGLADMFSLIICGEDVSAPKPAPDPYVLALEKTGLRPVEVLAFEDSETGILSAEAAGIAVVHVKEFAAA